MADSQEIRDAVTATVDLCHRMGAKGFECGYQPKTGWEALDEATGGAGLPVGAATWTATATFRGTRVISDEFDGPDEACMGLAAKLLDGAQCRRCGKTVAVCGDGVEFPGCRYSLVVDEAGARWQPGCGKPIDTSIPPSPLARDGVL